MNKELTHTRKAILKKMSVNEMGIQSGISSTNLHYKLKGKIKLTIGDIIKISSVLNLKPEEFFKIVLQDVGNDYDIRKKAKRHICKIHNCFEVNEAWKCCCYCPKVRECPTRCYNTPLRCGNYEEGVIIGQ